MKTGASERVALGFRAHSGWTVMVVVARSNHAPIVLERRRIETADASIRGSKQPYHAADRLEFEEADALIRTCRDSATRLATDAVSALVAQLTQDAHWVAGAGIVFASGRLLPDLTAILRSHALIHTAEGEFFREVLVQASQHCSLPVTRVREREIWDRGAAALGLNSAEVRRLIGELGRLLGPPWRQDQKLAALAGWIALAESACIREAKRLARSVNLEFYRYNAARPKFVAGPLTSGELQSISMKSCEVLHSMGPQIQWVQSYATGDKIYCIYIAPDEQSILEHAKRGGPADRVSKVTGIIDPATSEALAG